MSEQAENIDLASMDVYLLKPPSLILNTLEKLHVATIQDLLDLDMASVKKTRGVGKSKIQAIEDLKELAKETLEEQDLHSLIEGKSTTRYIIDELIAVGIDPDTDWRELLGPQVLMFPAVVYFEDGQAIDAHYGYNKNSQPSLETFLARHGYNDKPHHYHTLDAAYVDSAFPSREGFAQWLVMNKTSLSGVVFESVDLSGMLLSGCSFNGSILRDVNFDGADLRRCDFRCAKLEGTSLESAKTDNTTALPTSCD